MDNNNDNTPEKKPLTRSQTSLLRVMKQRSEAKAQATILNKTPKDKK